MVRHFGVNFSPRYSANICLKFGRELEISDKQNDQFYKSSAVLDEAYVQLTKAFNVSALTKDSTLTAGRFSSNDVREWLYDKGVDGFLIAFKAKKLNTEFALSWSREELIGSDLLNHDDKDSVSNSIFYAEHKPFNGIDLKFGLFGVVRKDSSSKNNSPKIWALRTCGKLFSNRLGFWTDFAWYCHCWNWVPSV